MKVIVRASLGLLLAAALAAGCSKMKPITAPALHSGGATFSVIAVLGENLSAGFQSGGLVDRHQTHSYAALFAQQVGARALDLPTVNGDGLPPLLRIRRLLPPPTLIDSIGRTTGSPTNFLLPTAYHNMSVPGAVLSDAMDSTTYYAVARNNPFFGLIARHRGKLITQVIEQLNPPATFVIIEYGSTEILGAGTRGSGLSLIPSVAFASLLGRTLDTLAVRTPALKGAILNIPDLASFPFFTTFPPTLLDASGNVLRNPNGSPRFLLGPNNVPMTAGDYVLLKASTLLAAGYGHPIGTFSYYSGGAVPGNGIGLADSMVLNVGEATNLQHEIDRDNAAIASQAAVRQLALVDVNGLLRAAATTGLEWRGSLYTNRFVTGGLFSLDGVHPNDFLHAWICNAVIDGVNAKFGSDIQHIDPTKFATLTSSRAGQARGESALPPIVLNSGTLLHDAFPWRGAAGP